ncbi:uncharacterized protein LOC132939978 [Metopolophium dirhodum]|uniref:uncharacterized protein LOC132939978 n=1 Tax=Metopolophium dirhodum TaxID=44670 RepID=UPI00298F47B9|nr:uncharacterized protein LOC132939978 [Metopolophium dirhodum]
MFKVSSMYTLVLYLLFTTNVLCNPVNDINSENNDPFWINPCGYNTNNAEDYDDSDAGIMDRILTIAKQCQSNIALFKSQYIQQTFNTDYDAHYKRWINENNSWVTSRLLDKAEDNMKQSWLNSRSFPSELKYSYEVLQRVSVGFEILLDDASKNDSLENTFSNNFSTCKNDLQQLLCELNDDIDVTHQEKPKDITRDEVPKEVREETSTANRNLTNSIIFRDYMIAIQYVKNTYDHLRSKCNNNLYRFKSLYKKNHHYYT